MKYLTCLNSNAVNDKNNSLLRTSYGGTLGYLVLSRVLSFFLLKSQKTWANYVCRADVYWFVDRIRSVLLLTFGNLANWLLLDMEQIPLRTTHQRSSRARRSAVSWQFHGFECWSRRCVYNYACDAYKQSSIWIRFGILFLEYLKIVHFDWIKKYGAIYRLWLGHPAVLISSPEFMEVSSLLVKLIVSNICENNKTYLIRWITKGKI